MRGLQQHKLLNATPRRVGGLAAYVRYLCPKITQIMRKISADWVFPVSAPPIEQGVVIADDAGRILAIESRAQHAADTLEIHEGILTPGFVNTHCHLELSHMRGKVDTGTGLIPFIRGVVTQRNAAPEVISTAIRAAETEMLEGGIVALGDISNAPDTFATKAQGRMRYYTFVELFDFLQDDGAQKAMDDWSAVYEQIELAPGSTRSYVPHAPYSVSPTLFEKIRTANGPSARHTISIHNQETPPENDLFLHKKGGFLDFYGGFGISLDHFEATAQPSIRYAMQHLDPAQRTLFVHNTLTTRADIEAAHDWSSNVFWATCPNANLYIENRLPDYSAFIEQQARVTIGTDSLTSNWQLSILAEMQAIARFQSYVSFETLLRWATLNGAEALGFDDELGSFEPFKTPGILLLQGMAEGHRLTAQTTVRRLV
jgi:aminodeoxyfutalosine deaminase